MEILIFGLFSLFDLLLERRAANHSGVYRRDLEARTWGTGQEDQAETDPGPRDQGPGHAWRFTNIYLDGQAIRME